ncbi:MULTISPECIES: ABC transporter permease [Pseudomonas]|uniref:ABC transporter permease n=1 Tax=Pseudomonas TaxID=286 RepID=UPI0008EAB723|nr:ABC transporter permease [Pseudomonas marincola]SFT76591.1 lipopolysaccharide transport system permease protein [Pseudomonas marincola]
MQSFPANPRSIIDGFWNNRHLIKSFVIRDVLGRYRGSIMGLLWSFLNPLFMLVVYTFVFSVVFKARWGTGSDSKTEFALILFSGLIVFSLFAECINRAPTLIVNNPNYVKKVIFPLEILPWINLGSALFHSVISLVVWMLAYIIFFGLPHITVFYLPLVLIPLLLLIMGLSWALSSLGVYLRDVSQFIGIVTSTMMFLSPIFYPVTALPESYRWVLYLNPLTPVIEQMRNVLFWGKIPDFKILAIYTVIMLLVALLGFVWFQKTRKGFADVI